MEQKKKKSFTILGTSIWKILAYFIIYSFVGFIIETLFALVFYNVLESRQSFLYGPFCGIYGVGAVFMYVILNKYFKKNNHLLFLGGFIVGSFVEYVLSFLGEILLNVRWWDYSNRFLNINGRICFLYSLFWGLLGVYFMKVINPKVDKVIEFIKKKVDIKVIKSTVLIVFILLLIDCAVSGIAIEYYLVRQITKNDLDVQNKEAIVRIYNNVYSNEKKVKIIDKFFNDKKMIMTYPNLTITLNDGTVKRVREYLPDIKPYYFKFNVKNIKNDIIE